MDSLRHFAASRPAGWFPGIVSSKMRTCFPAIITKSGLSEDVERLVGIVAGGLLQALNPGRSAYSFSDSFSAAERFLAIDRRTESWHQVYLPWFRALAHH